MYFWNIHQLKKDLIANKVTERHRLYYLLLAFLMLHLGFMIELSLFEEMTMGELVLKGGGVILLCLGLPLCYKANGGDKGQNFLGRYLSISWVVGIRSIVVMVLFIFAAIAVEYWVVGDQALEGGTSLPLAVVSIGVCIGLFWRIIVHIKDVARQN